MTQEDRDRLGMLLFDAHRALDEAWQLCHHSGDSDSTNRLVLADMQVIEVDKNLDLYSMRI